ncbi:hypothetical protein [Azotosporobacter soli]|uniref:tetratricopeptide repeat protein n=1 Tax=Azotosporobacter soli TaxID=3055040 RepID=UPI0031FEE278
MKKRLCRAIGMAMICFSFIATTASAAVLSEAVQEATVSVDQQESLSSAKDRAALAARAKVIPRLAGELRQYWQRQRPELVLREEEYQAAALALSSLTVLSEQGEGKTETVCVKARVTLQEEEATLYLQHFSLPSLFDGRRTLAQWHDLQEKYAQDLADGKGERMKKTQAYLLLERGYRQTLAMENRLLRGGQLWQEKIALYGMGILLGQPVPLLEMGDYGKALGAGILSDFMQAGDYYTQSIAAYPTTAAYCERAIASLIQANPGQAKLDLDKAMMLDPSDARIYTVRALSRLHFPMKKQSGLLTEENRKLALEDLDKAIERQPQQAWLYADRALLHLYSTQNEAALDDWKTYLALSPQLRGSLTHLIYALQLENNGHPYRALQEYGSYLQAAQAGDFFRSAVESRQHSLREKNSASVK